MKYPFVLLCALGVPGGKETLSRLSRLVACGAILGAASFAQAQQPTLDPDFVGTAFDRYTTKDNLGRTITFYLTRVSDKKLPLIVLIQGSGAQSIWVKRGDKISGGLQNLTAAAAKGKARVLAVEKPGIDCFYQPGQPGTAEGAPQAFLEEQTLPRWAEANEAAIRAALTLPGTAPGKILVAGHSEGAITAAKIAADMPDVTHVAILSGSGANQLFDMALSMGEDETYKAWAEIQKDPDSTTKFAWGHPYRRWSSFCSTSTLEELEKSKAHILVAHGTEDKAVPYQSFEVLRAGLTATNRDAHYEIVQGGGHDYAKPNDPPADGFRIMFGKLVDWFLG